MKTAKNKDKRLREKLNKLIDTTNAAVSALSSVDELVEKSLEEVLTKKYKPRDFANFMLSEFFKIYETIGGRKKMIQYLKKHPEDLFRLMEKMAQVATSLESMDNRIEEAKQKSKTPEAQKGVVIQFIGVNQNNNNNQDDKVVIDVNKAVQYTEKAIQNKLAAPEEG